MQDFINPEVIAGVFLAIYFISKGVYSLFNRNPDEKSVSHSYKCQLAMSEIKQLRRDIDAIRDKLELWDDKIQAGEFSCKWDIRDVPLVIDKVNRLDKLEAFLRNKFN